MRAIGKPQPRFWLLCCGKASWFAGVSGMLAVEPSTMTTRRSWNSQSLAARRPEAFGRLADQPGQQRLGEPLASRLAVAAGVGREVGQAPGHTPGQQPGHGASGRNGRR